MTALRAQQIKETTKRAITYWMKAQVAAGRTESEIKHLYSLAETKQSIMQSAKNLMN